MHLQLPFTALFNLQDRLPWLNTLHDVISSWSDDPSPRARPQPHGESSSASEGLIGVLACSALKRVYRDILSGHHSALLQGSGGVAPNQASVVTSCVFVLLKASEEVLTQRLMARRGHFMPASLVRSQLDILELPNDQERAVVIETDGLGIDDILTRIIDKLKHRNIE